MLTLYASMDEILKNT